MDIFSISYSLTPNIPFLIDYDFLYYGLMRKKSMTIDCQGSFYLIPSEKNFSSVGIVLKRTDKVWQGWGSSRDSAKRSKQMKKSRATKSSDALHIMLGGFSINKRSCK
ncbi:Oidioi.mRNA.OKI2018_I69.PAR.g12179.t1.cds [Oikopleura dioica]|uniref:Oidioi.mRNA.OKI2018_I69.PAR.g12179.t1.cds n=1 Tax=Oikopleura dioica TaxID=34765 RepID=A0ABN7RYY1_OIKDI|nr:Oidioi.mRNA.OKI2018_I69.PAR.g12179.t1.cds [Oikopleura dioica]